MSVVLLLTDTFGSGGVYGYINKDKKEYTVHCEVEDYLKAGLPKKYVLKLMQYAEREEVWDIGEDKDSEFVSALKKLTMELFSKVHGESVPSIKKAGKLVQYLYQGVIDSDDMMFFIDEEEIPYVEEELQDSWEHLLKECKKDMVRYHLEDVIELGETLTAYGDLQTCFYE